MNERQDTATLVETVQEALPCTEPISVAIGESCGECQNCEARAALTALKERIARDFKTTCQAWGNDVRIAEAAKAKLAEAENGKAFYERKYLETKEELAAALRSLRGET